MLNLQKNCSKWVVDPNNFEFSNSGIWSEEDDEQALHIVVYNPELTFEGLYEKVSTYSQIASAIERRQIGK